MIWIILGLLLIMAGNTLLAAYKKRQFTEPENPNQGLNEFYDFVGPTTVTDDGGTRFYTLHGVPFRGTTDVAATSSISEGTLIEGGYAGNLRVRLLGQEIIEMHTASQFYLPNQFTRLQMFLRLGAATDLHSACLYGFNASGATSATGMRALGGALLFTYAFYRDLTISNNWMVIYQTGEAFIFNRVITTVPITNAPTLLRLECVGTNIYYYINNTLVHTATNVYFDATGGTAIQINMAGDDPTAFTDTNLDAIKITQLYDSPRSFV